MTNCFYEGKEYSEGSLICKNKRELKCASGEWKETGYDCNSTKFLVDLEDIRFIDDKELVGVDRTVDQNKKPVITTNYTVYAEYFSIARGRDFLRFKGAYTPGGICSGEGVQHDIPIDDVISIEEKIRCQSNPTRHYKIIVYRT